MRYEIILLLVIFGICASAEVALFFGNKEDKSLVKVKGSVFLWITPVFWTLVFALQNNCDSMMSKLVLIISSFLANYSFLSYMFERGSFVLFLYYLKYARQEEKYANKLRALREQMLDWPVKQLIIIGLSAFGSLQYILVLIYTTA